MGQIEERKMKNGQENPFDFIESCDTAALCRVLEQEDPLMISLLLGSLSLHKAAAVLQELPERLWLPVIEDLAQGNWESADMVECLAADMQNKIEQHTQVPYTELGSIDFIEKFITSLSPGEISDSPLDSMLNVLMDTKHVNMLEYMLTLIRETNPAAYTALKKHIFLFEDIVKLDDLSIQKMLRETFTEDLTRALKTASPALQAKIERNMSARAFAMLREEIESMRPISIWEVREAQQKLVSILRRFAHHGEIVLP